MNILSIIVLLSNNVKIILYLYKNDLNRKITCMIICIYKKEQYEQLKELVNFLNSSIEKQNFELDLYLIIANKCFPFKTEYNINNDIKNIF